MRVHHLQVRAFTAKVVALTIIFSIGWVALFPHNERVPKKADLISDQQISWAKDEKFVNDGSVNQDEIDKEIEQTIQNILTPTHSAAQLDSDSWKLYQNACTVYADICNKVSREWSYNDQEKLTYQLLTIYLIKQIDQRLDTESKLRSTLSQLKIYNDDEDRRGSAGHTYVKMNVEKIPSTREYREVLTHELGHIIDLGVLNGNASQKDPTYTEFGNIERSIDDPSLKFYEISRENEDVRKASATYKDFVSGYAMKWIYEEFAECANLRFNHNELFKQLAQENHTIAKKYAFFNKIFNGKSFNADTDNISLISNDKRPWDTTKLD